MTGSSAFRRWVVAGGVVLLSGTAPAATVVVPAEFREVVADAALIVRGRITDVRAVAVPGRGVDSVATVVVDAVLKGPASAFVSVRVPGGTLGRYRFVMVGAPVLRAGDTAVFFLARDAGNRWRPVGLSAGVVRVEADLSGRPAVRPPILLGSTASVGRIVRGDRRRASLPVVEFEAVVRLVVADQHGLREVAAP